MAHERTLQAPGDLPGERGIFLGAAVSRVPAICHADGVPVVTQGGRTDLAPGRIPQAGEIVLSLERMNRIEAVDPDGGTATVQAFGAALQAAVHAPDVRRDIMAFGHVDDAKRHVAGHCPPERPGRFDAIAQTVYGRVGARCGSISAGHGIGWRKREFLPRTRRPAASATMRTLEAALDPRSILNRGRILDTGTPA